MTSPDAVSSGRGPAWLALAGVWLVYAVFGSVAASLAPLVQEIGADIGAGNSALGGVFGAWPLTYVVAAIPCGVLLDRVGIRIGLFGASLVMAVSCWLRSVAETPVELFLAVAVFGLGGPIISVGAPKLIAALFEGPRRGMAMGIYITGPSIGTIAALSLTNSVLLPLVGDWRGVMLIQAGAALAAGFVWLGLSAFAEVPRPVGRSQRYGAAAAAHLLRDRQIVLLLAIGVGVFYVIHALNNWLPNLLNHAGMDPVAAGNWATIPTLVGLAASLALPRFATPDRRLAILATLFAICLAASLLLQFAPGPLLVLGLALIGVTRGTMVTVALLALVELPSLPKEQLGLAGGIFFAAAEFGGMLGPLAFGVIVDATGSFAPALASLSVASLLLLSMTALLARGR